MTITRHVALAGAIVLLTTACTSKEISRNLYDGLQKRETIVHPADGPPTADSSVSYDQYQRERAQP